MDEFLDTHGTAHWIGTAHWTATGGVAVGLVIGAVVGTFMISGHPAQNLPPNSLNSWRIPQLIAVIRVISLP